MKVEIRKVKIVAMVGIHSGAGQLSKKEKPCLIIVLAKKSGKKSGDSGKGCGR
jgi:hypothetical protein